MNKQENNYLTNNVAVNNEFLNQENNQQIDWNNFGEIPELPTGQILRFELLSPWDDPNYIGLERIEIFNSRGERPLIIETFTNSLEYYGNLFNLFGEKRQQRPSTSPLINKRNNKNEVVNNNVNNRKWFCNYRILPSDSSEPIHISLRFHGNYSGSRIHALRGVRNLRIWLDNNCIFYGEICCAVGNSTTQGDTILFTINEEILAKIAEHDEQISQQITEFTIEQQHNPNTVGMENLIQSSTLPNVNTVPFRPITGYNNFAQSSTSSPHSLLVISDGEYSEQNYIKENQKEKEIENEEEKLNYSNNINGKLFHIEILENWGSTEYIGLTGIQFLGPGFSPINENIVKECVIRCEPVINEELKRGELKNLLNGINLTCDPENMWITNKLILNNSEDEMVKQSSIFLSFTFPKEIRISIWNYNASTELSYVGVRCARFYANGKLINGIGDILLRKAPGFVFFDFVQDVLFDRCLLQRPLSCARPQTRSVAAFIYQLRLLSTWGDEFYIGLNGIELFNRHDKIINLHPQNLAAFPESVNCLTSVRDDPRTSDKLIDGCNDTTKVYHMWLTPILPNSYARVFIIFDTPTFVTRIRIYNYRKTPERGVRHIALSADDLLLCSGAEVPASSPESTGILDLPLRDVDEN